LKAVAYTNLLERKLRSHAVSHRIPREPPFNKTSSSFSRDQLRPRLKFNHYAHCFQTSLHMQL